MSNSVLKYGDLVYIENGLNGWQGGYLDTCNGSTVGLVYEVSTSATPTRAKGTGTWEIMSASGKAKGTDVISGDHVFLKNQFGAGTYLDINGAATPAPSIYSTGTYSKTDRDGNGTTQWKVCAVTSNPQDTRVREGDVVNFLSGFTSGYGGFLEVNGPPMTAVSNQHNVVTSAYTNRVPGSGDWRFSKVPPKAPLKYGDLVHIVNGHNNWQGGYLDTCHGSSIGLTLDVSTAHTPTRAANTGTWEILSPSGKAKGTDVLSGDALWLKNMFGSGTYLDINQNATPAPNLYRVGSFAKPDRDGNGTCQWRVLTVTSNPVDGKVREDDVFHLLNSYNNTGGGFLDTYGPAPAPNKLGVVTSTYANRDNGSGLWKFVKVQQP